MKDYPRIRYLQQDLWELSTQLSVPLYVLGSVAVPNLKPVQNAAIDRVTRILVGSISTLDMRVSTAGIFFDPCPTGDLLGGGFRGCTKRSARAMQLFGRLAVLEPHTL